MAEGPGGDPATGLPQLLDHERHVALTGRSREPWVRRLILVVLAVVVALALVGTFGQRDDVSRAASLGAVLRVSAPQRLRGGLFYQGRFDILATSRLAHPHLVLAPGWTDQMQINTIEPSADSEAAPQGRLELAYPPMQSGDRLTVWMQFEANPAAAPGSHDQSVALYDGDRLVARIHRRVTVFF